MVYGVIMFYRLRLTLRIGLFFLASATVVGSACAQVNYSSATSSNFWQHGVDVPEVMGTTGFEEYELGPGDEIAVVVAGRPELSGTQMVGPDGRITLPLAGSVNVNKLTRDLAASIVSKALSVFYTEVSVTLQVVRYGSNHILLLGNVEHPGLLSFEQPPTLLEAVTRGGLSLGSDKTARLPRKCIVYRGDHQVVSVNVEELLEDGKAFTDVQLRKNDIVYVPGDQDHVVSVIGEVKNPGAVILTRSTTLIKLIAESGGLTPQAGDPTIQIVHISRGNVQRIAFKDLLTTNRSADVQLTDGDIVFVPKSGLAKTGFVLQQIAPLAQIGTLATFTNH